MADRACNIEVGSPGTGFILSTLQPCCCYDSSSYPARRLRVISALASGSPGNDCRSGSHLSVRPSISARLHKWQEVIVRW